MESSSAHDFDAYLRTKKIDPEKFKEGSRERYDQFKVLFDQVHPASFTQQKLFLINNIRREYLLESKAGEVSKAVKKMKPKIQPKPKLS